MAGKNRKIQIFESSIERVARILSKKWKIRVVFQTDRCETSGSTIYLPVLPDNASTDLTNAMQGYLDHEAAHVVYTDFKALNRVKKLPKTMTVLNALEDPRIEKKWCDLYPGARINLKRAQEWALNKVAEEKEMVDPEDGVKKKMRSWNGLTDLGKFLHASITYACNAFDDSHWFLKDIVEADIMNDVKKYSSYFQKALAVDSTTELVPIAKELLEKLGQDDPEQPDPEESEEESEEDGTGTSGSPASSGGSSPQSQVMNKQPKNQKQTGPSQAQAVPGMFADKNANKSRYDVSEEGIKNDQDLTNLADQIKEAAKHELVKEDCYLVYTTEGDSIERIKDGDRMRYKEFMLESIRLVAPMKRKMSRSMLATKQSNWEGDKTRGKINPRRVYQVPMGTSKRVFRQRVESEDYDTCVLMMVDHSGSMAGPSLDLAAKTSIIFGELLNQIGVPFSVLGFSTGSESVASDRISKASDEERTLYRRWGNLWIGEYKNFEESWSSAGPKIINMVRNSKINTYDGESLRYGAQVLLARPEKRKILFWLNDGYPQPNYGDDYSAHTKYAKDCALEVEKAVELFAIGIRTDAVKRFYKNCVQVNSVEDLPKTCLSELDALIRKGKTYHSKG